MIGTARAVSLVILSAAGLLAPAVFADPSSPALEERRGEAYVEMGRRDDARRILEHLRPLDASRADELAEAIEKMKSP